MKVNNYIPHPALKEYIFSISTVDFMLPEGMKDVVTPYPTTPFQSIMFYCDNQISMGRMDYEDCEKQPLIVVVGPQFSRVNLKVDHKVRAIRVDLLPGGMYRLLGIPMYELFDAGFDAHDIFGAEMRCIKEQLQEIKEMEEGKKIVEKFLLSKVNGLKEKLPIDSALQTLFRIHGNMSMDKIASLSCLSLRQFERKCKQRLGMNPKTFARILRFSKAYRLHEVSPRLSWIEIAYQAGYYDQMHMIRDFKVFAGVNPSVIEHQLLSTPLRMQRDLPI